MKKALFIGINYIHNPSTQLNGCIDDVTNMSKILQSHYGYSPENMVMLTDDTEDPGHMPTKTRILQALMELVASSSECEEIWIHYSGHGSVIQGYNGSAIVPVDYYTNGFITDMEIHAIVRHAACRTMILMDSCNSGTMGELEWNFEYLYGATFMRTQINSGTIANPHIFMFSGSKRNQSSVEVIDRITQRYEGAFTDAFLHALQQNSYTITLGKLIQDVCVHLHNEHIENQRPVLSSSSPEPRWTLVPVYTGEHLNPDAHL